ncbi:MAG TPA: hypothetical protein VMT62_14140 [Syntrophorhabdaceae bacterium]|nr:hypothetical protein [Syntrophorhabdaceae bacterium]
MNLRFDMKTLWKCIFIGFYLLIEGMILQRSKAILLLHKQPLAMGFLVEVAIFYFSTGFLMAAVYFIIKDALPGRRRYTRGLFYGLLVAFGVGFGLILDIIGLDFEGKFDLLTPYKIEAYLITAADLINFIITGMVLGVVADRREIKSNQMRFNKKGLAIASVAGLILYPATNLLISVLVDPVVSLVSDIPGNAVRWFYAGFFVPLAVNGAVIPLFYCLTKDAFTGGWVQRPLQFFLVYYFGYLVILSFFGLPFGFSLQAVLHFLIIIIVPTFLIAGLTAKLQDWYAVRETAMKKRRTISEH